MASLPPPPSPVHLLRSHFSPVNVLSFSNDNERLYSGDTSGLVVITSTRSLRAIASWKAHSDGLLGVEEWDAHIITHGRDNKIHVWARIDEFPAAASIRLGGSASLPGLPTPNLRYSLDVNALNYCRFSLLPLLQAEHAIQNTDTEALIAVPNLVESSLADVWTLPACQRLHAAIGKQESSDTESDGRGNRQAEGIIMSMHLFTTLPDTASSSSSPRELRLLCAYENGGVILRRYTGPENKKTIEGIGWQVAWSSTLHVESVMAMAVSRACTFALTVSADHLVGRYDLISAGLPGVSLEDACKVYRTKKPGNAAIAIRDDGKVCAIGGWDGKVRLYSTKTMKPLGTLEYHKQSCQAVAFARSTPSMEKEHDSTVQSGLLEVTDDEESDDEMSEEEMRKRGLWLVAGGKDSRLSVWTLMSFDKR
ncbi:hypothetical protein SERLA73DRAFT_168506 [Serpula lacrymans var. lacrymans S7.3]|uniref:ASTRA-associated protein 1 n=2 Tax=Serpula lacrymans var. lacrymans TaxID=341189 RepID=F8PYG9_SERL3|nr:uncharacterized protein SERLADRAFT_361544 [Serpula lacrymans var. lacrymans S7.9]EGN98932.1 hypothetical protein SERLA73DRAFT_168506 [Serpula lacrymans var. lacrymans S7.3]EGO24520.1 hypothetical protein SERLADRAFT_361544 [Serpula lacrymans var. lacrymans S7.9]